MLQYNVIVVIVIVLEQPHRLLCIIQHTIVRVDRVHSHIVVVGIHKLISNDSSNVNTHRTVYYECATCVLHMCFAIATRNYYDIPIIIIANIHTRFKLHTRNCVRAVSFIVYLATLYSSPIDSYHVDLLRQSGVWFLYQPDDDDDNDTQNHYAVHVTATIKSILMKYVHNS